MGLIVVTAAVVMYAPTIHDYFIQDDFGVVGLFSRRSLAMFPRWFVAPWTEDIWGYVPDEIRPFPAASYVIASWFGAAAPEPNHVLNIAVHAVNGLLVMWIAGSAAGLGALAAGAAGLIFVLLPIQAESVAWITGRVDSLPACFYFASFLLYVRDVRLKPDASGTRYWASVALFVAALFSKQNTITMFPALLLFDLIADPNGPRRIRDLPWRRYVPYILLTIAFLALRYALFHEVAREGALNAERVREFVSDSSKHLVRLVFGGPGVREWTWRDTGWIVGITVFIALADAKRQMLATAVDALAHSGEAVSRRFEKIRVSIGPTWRSVLYFGPIWIALGMAPILVSGYYSPRHMYLASLGWAVVLGAGLEMLWYSWPAGPRRLLAVICVGMLFVGYGAQLRGVVRDWNRHAAISHAAVEQIEREAMATPQGTLIVAGVPGASWNFAIPHSLHPPFTPTDLTTRVEVISDSSDHCCDAPHWTAYTREALQTWQAAGAPAVALRWDERTGAMSRVSDQDDPQLRTFLSLLARANSREQMDQEIRGLLNDYVALR